LLTVVTQGLLGLLLMYCFLMTGDGPLGTTMHKQIEGHRESPYLAKLEADRQAQHSGYGVRSIMLANGSYKWEAYGWERITELQFHYTSYAIFNNKGEAEQYFNNIVNG
jgi:hypothetical protein